MQMRYRPLSEVGKTGQSLCHSGIEFDHIQLVPLMVTLIFLVVTPMLLVGIPLEPSPPFVIDIVYNFLKKTCETCEFISSISREGEIHCLY